MNKQYTRPYKRPLIWRIQMKIIKAWDLHKEFVYAVFLMIAILLLSSCNIDDPEMSGDLPQDVSYSYKEVTELGIYVDWNEDTSGWLVDWSNISQRVDTIWMEVQACTQIFVDVPSRLTINFIKPEDLPENTLGHINWSIPNDTAYIEVGSFDPSGDQMLVTRHEMIHWLLATEGVHTNDHHDSIFFDECESNL